MRVFVPTRDASKVISLFGTWRGPKLYVEFMYRDQTLRSGFMVTTEKPVCFDWHTHDESSFAIDW